MRGYPGKLTEAVDANQHYPHTGDQQSEFRAESGAVPEYELGDQCTRKGYAAIDQNAGMGGGRKRKARVNK